MSTSSLAVSFILWVRERRVSQENRGEGGRIFNWREETRKGRGRKGKEEEEEETFATWEKREEGQGCQVEWRREKGFWNSPVALTVCFRWRWVTQRGFLKSEEGRRSSYSWTWWWNRGEKKGGEERESNGRILVWQNVANIIRNTHSHLHVPPSPKNRKSHQKWYFLVGFDHRILPSPFPSFRPGHPGVNHSIFSSPALFWRRRRQRGSWLPWISDFCLHAQRRRGKREEEDFNSLCGFSDYLRFDFASAEEDVEGDLTTKTDVLPVSVWS